MVRGKARSALTLGSVLWLTAPLGCASILGIEEARCDFDVDPACDPENGDDESDATTGDGGANPPETEPAGTQPPETEPTDNGPPMDQQELCEEYCGIMENTCAQAEGTPQYSNVNSCMVICTTGLSFGAPGDREVNTAFCRYESALNVGVFGEPAEDCSASGLGAEGACEDICEVYCDLLGSQCSGVMGVEEVEIVEDFEACVAACPSIPRTGLPFNFGTDNSGNTLECRFWHVQATFGNVIPHCQHAAGLSTCVE